MRVTRRVFQEWLHNRPDLLPHEEKALGKKGYYRADLGPAFSFKGFDSWRSAMNSLMY